MTKRQVYWVGLESNSRPHGYGEDHREYVTVDDDNAGEKLNAAIVRIATTLTNLCDGDRIAVHMIKN